VPNASRRRNSALAAGACTIAANKIGSAFRAPEQ
jgi:hypothetical protein